MKKLIIVAMGLFALSANANDMSPVLVGESHDGMKAFAYPGTLTRFNDAYQLLIGTKMPNSAEERVYVVIEKKDCRVKHGTAYFRTTSTGNFIDKTTFSFHHPISIVDFVSLAVCTAGMYTEHKVSA